MRKQCWRKGFSTTRRFHFPRHGLRAATPSCWVWQERRRVSPRGRSSSKRSQWGKKNDDLEDFLEENSARLPVAGCKSNPTRFQDVLLTGIRSAFSDQSRKAEVPYYPAVSFPTPWIAGRHTVMLGLAGGEKGLPLQPKQQQTLTVGQEE